MKQTISSAQIYECAKVNDISYGSFKAHAFF